MGGMDLKTCPWRRYPALSPRGGHAPGQTVVLDMEQGERLPAGMSTPPSLLHAGVHLHRHTRGAKGPAVGIAAGPPLPRERGQRWGVGLPTPSEPPDTNRREDRTPQTRPRGLHSAFSSAGVKAVPPASAEERFGARRTWLPQPAWRRGTLAGSQPPNQREDCNSAAGAELTGPGLFTQGAKGASQPRGPRLQPGG